MSQNGGSMFGLVLMFLVTIFLGLGLVWVNIERVDLAYELKTLERTYLEKQDQNSKLLVERHARQGGKSWAASASTRANSNAALGKKAS